MLDPLSILGLFLAIEGAVYAVAPSMMKQMAAQIIEMDDSKLRNAGLICLCVGVGLVWLMR